MPTTHLSHQRPLLCRRVHLIDGDTLEGHARDRVDIVLLTDGAAFHLDAPLGTGSIIIAAPGTRYTLERTRGVDAYVLSVLGDWLMDEARASWRNEEGLPAFWTGVLLHRTASLPRFTLSPETLRGVVRELEDLRAATEDTAPLYLKATLLKLLAITGAAYARETQSADDEVALPLPVTRVLDEIEHSLADGHPFRVADAAAAAAITADHLCRLFREATGESPRAYYQRRRVQEAARLLHDPTRSVGAIAKQLGYCDAAHFTNIFKGVQGVTPSAYRKRFGR